MLYANVEIDNEKVRDIFERIEKAREELYKCYAELGYEAAPVIKVENGEEPHP